MVSQRPLSIVEAAEWGVAERKQVALLGMGIPGVSVPGVHCKTVIVAWIHGGTN